MGISDFVTKVGEGSDFKIVGNLKFPRHVYIKISSHNFFEALLFCDTFPLCIGGGGVSIIFARKQGEAYL